MGKISEIKKFKGTKGPWSYRPDASGDTFYIETEDKDRFDSFVGDVGGGLQLKHEIEANAQLVSTSPELLSDLQDFVRYTEYFFDFEKTVMNDKEHQFLILKNQAKRTINKSLNL